jgi:hypothetical protein
MSAKEIIRTIIHADKKTKLFLTENQWHDNIILARGGENKNEARQIFEKTKQQRL